MVTWPNGKALDYESRDSRFDPWCDQHKSFLLLEFFFFYLGQASSVWLFVGCVVLIMFLFGTNYCLVRHPYYSNSKDNTKHSHDSGAQAGIW
jgi:hypothetical protein